MNTHNQNITSFGPFNRNWTGNGISQGRSSVKPWPIGRDCFIFSAFKEAGTSIPGFYFYLFFLSDTQQRLVSPIECVFLCLVPLDLMHC
jgi:hypothetical protein